MPACLYAPLSLAFVITRVWPRQRRNLIIMNKLTPDEEKKILESSPKGTFALLLLMAAIFAVGWAFMYFGRFLEHGAVT